MKLANCFNTQPPEGGWIAYFVSALMVFSFNTQPPEGGWIGKQKADTARKSFNTQPPEGGWKPVLIVLKNCQVSTHSRPKAAGCLTR